MQQPNTYHWAVVGAGPAGIAAVGALLDAGAAPEKIAWIDPAFAVGDFGTLWRVVPSNTKVQSFLRSLNAIKSFDVARYEKSFALFKLEPQSTCQIAVMADVLQAITEDIKTRVSARKNFVREMTCVNNAWTLTLADKDKIIAERVILAIGAEPKTLAHQFTTISLADALNEKLLAPLIQAHDKVAVFGSSHSAMLVIKNLLSTKLKQIINFYRAPLRFAIDMDDWILFDDTGLKGSTALWARENLLGKLPENLIRLSATEINITNHADEITQAIYAVGFERRAQPKIIDHCASEYQPKTGIIAPGLFGLGIAFPEHKANRLGMVEARVGIWKFVDYLQTILPIWEKYTA